MILLNNLARAKIKRIVMQMIFRYIGQATFSTIVIIIHSINVALSDHVSITTAHLGDGQLSFAPTTYTRVGYHQLP